MITQDELKLLFLYNSFTGVFTWLVNKGKRGKADHIAGHIESIGYVQVGINGKKYRMHRLAWLYVYGEMPIEIDHINGNRSDNRISNLRSVERQENMMNKKIRSNNSSGFNGVSFCKKQKQWKARIKFKGENIHLGFYDDKNNAVDARKEANIKYGFHENHGRK